MPTYNVRDALDADAEHVEIEADGVLDAARAYAEREFREEPSGDSYDVLVTAPNGRTYEVCVDVEIEVTFEPMVVREVPPAPSNDDNKPATPAERTAT